MKAWIVFDDSSWKTKLTGFNTKEEALVYLNKLWRKEIDSNNSYQSLLEEDFNNDEEELIECLIEENNEELFWYREVEIK